MAALAAAAPSRASSSHFHPQCFLAHNHFAGTDAARAGGAASRSPTIRRSTRSGSRAAATAPAGSPRTRSRGSARRRGTRPSSAIATPASCSPASTAPAFPTSRMGRCRRTSMREGGEAAVRARARLAGPTRSPDALEPGLEPGAAPRRLQHHRARPAARHAARARPRRPCPAARGGVGAYLRDRPGDVPHHRAAPTVRRVAGIRLGRLQRRAGQRSRFRRGRGGGGPLLVRRAPESPISAAPTSATIRPTRWCRSAASEPRLATLSTEIAPTGAQTGRISPLAGHCQGGGFALYRAQQIHREGRMAQGRQSGLQRPVTPSADLAAITGSDPLPRSQVVSKVWDHIRKNNLQNPAEQARDPRRRQAEEDLRQGPLLDVRDEQASVAAI